VEILEVTPAEYAEIIKAPYNAFGSAPFNDLNKNKCNEPFYLLFKEGKFRLGIIGGSKDTVFYSPFSAPYGGFSFVQDDIRLQYIEDAVRLLKIWALEKKFSSINITLPPAVLEGNFISKQISCLYREGFKLLNIDLNYSYNLNNLNDNYSENIWYNARKNLRIALNSGLSFLKCGKDEEKEQAYDIIRQNRENRGYPLRMAWDQVFETVRLIPADFFIVRDENQVPVASALVFHVSKSVVQVIYWGDLQGFSEKKPMNYIAYQIFKYYKSAGKEVVDIGPSTENSIPNYGLCEFKESMGCNIHPKITFTLAF
jgi:hypothetical protein